MWDIFPQNPILKDKDAARPARALNQWTQPTIQVGHIVQNLKNIVQNWRNIDQILKEILFKIWQTQYFQMIKRPCMWFCYDELHHFVQKSGQMEIVFAILCKNLVKWK